MTRHAMPGGCVSGPHLARDHRQDAEVDRVGARALHHREERRRHDRDDRRPVDDGAEAIATPVAAANTAWEPGVARPGTPQETAAHVTGVAARNRGRDDRPDHREPPDDREGPAGHPDGCRQRRQRGGRLPTLPLRIQAETNRTRPSATATCMPAWTGAPAGPGQRARERLPPADRAGARPGTARIDAGRRLSCRICTLATGGETSRAWWRRFLPAPARAGRRRPRRSGGARMTWGLVADIPVPWGQAPGGGAAAGRQRAAACPASGRRA